MFHGSIVALVTPMKSNGDIDYDAVSKLIEHHIKSGTNGIVIAGTTGEAATLTHKEKIDLIRYAEKHAGERIAIIAGTGANSTREAADLTYEAMTAGVDACLLMTPSYIKPTQEGLYQHFRYIAEHAAIPQILYNVPGRTAVDLLPETVERLSHTSNIIGIKEATGDLGRAKRIMELCGSSMGVYSGDDMLAKDMILAGAKGVISVTANVAPVLMSLMCEAARAGDAVKAEEIDRKIRGLHKALFVEPNPTPCKWALQQLGLIEDGIRLPMMPLSEQFHPEVREAIKQAGL